MTTFDSLSSMQLADYNQAQQVYNQIGAELQAQSAENWVMMAPTTSQILVINTTVQSKPLSWQPISEMNNTTKVPLAFPWAMALRVKWMLNNLP